MKKITVFLGICICFTAVSYGQKTTAQKLTVKESRKILEKVWNDVKTSDTADFIKMWVMDNTEWPYHGGQKFGVNEIKNNFEDFKSYFDSALVKKLKFDKVTCDTVEQIDPHYSFSKYYIKALFKYSNTRERGFGFYMDYVNNQWSIRFSPDYLDVASRK